MKTVAFKGSIKSYQDSTDWKDSDGKPFVFPIEYTGEAEVYTSVEEAKTAGVWPNEADILDSQVNGKVVTAAKAKVYQEKTSAIKEAYENSPAFKRNNLIKAILASGTPSKPVSQADAEAMADSILK